MADPQVTIVEDATVVTVIDDRVVVTSTPPSVQVATIGIQGPPGIGDKYFVYTQGVPLSTWAITHNLNKKPAVMVVDSAETVVVGEIEYVDDNSLVVTFVGAFSGKAYLN